MTRRGLYSLAVCAVAALTAVAIWKTKSADSPWLALERQPRGIMGTDCQLAVVFPKQSANYQEPALEAAERELRLVEAQMSTYIESSEISRFNRAGAGEPVLLGNATWKVLEEARFAFERTRGVFDVTCRPLIELWRQAGQLGVLPEETAIRKAREESTWGQIELLGGAARKTVGSSQVDLGGIAKGFAIDRAVEALRAAGAVGGLVNVGGDVRCFGHQANGRGWLVQIRHPSGEGLWEELRVSDTAVCTSGNYARFSLIEGKNYSHIIDPRSGRPAEAAASVTVLASTALEADVWATALSVLGPEGLEAIPTGEGIEALILTLSDSGWSSAATPGFEEKTSER